MSITKLQGFKGEAEVFGALKGVVWDNNTLTIFGVSVDEAYAVLDHASAGKIEAVRVRAPVEENVKPAQPDKFPSHAGTAVPAKEAAPAEVSKAALVHAAVAGVPQSAAAKEMLEKSEIQRLAEEPASRPTSKPAKEAAAAPPPSTAPNADGIPENIAKSKRFIEVLDWVMKARGLKPDAVDQLVSECEKLKAAVPVIARVRDIREKVESNLAAYKEAGEVPA